MKNSYSQIYNPKTKKCININSQLGKYIAFRYLNKIGGGKINDGPCPENSNFYCPISQNIMKDPVICCDGQTYERAHIQKWFAQCEAKAAPLGHNPVYTSPLTLLPLANNNLIPNIALKNAIEEYNQWLKQKEEKEKKEEKEEKEDTNDKSKSNIVETIKKTPTNIFHANLESSNVLPLASVESSTALPQVTVESSTALPQASVESSTALPQVTVESSTALPQASVESSSTLPQDSVESSSTLPQASVQSYFSLPSFDDLSVGYNNPSEEYDDPHDIFWDEIIKIARKFFIPDPDPDEIHSFSEIIEILERIWRIHNGLYNPWKTISDNLGRVPYGQWEYLLLLMWELGILQAIYYSIFGRPSPSYVDHNHISMLSRIYYSNYDERVRDTTLEEMLEYLIFGPN